MIAWKDTYMRQSRPEEQKLYKHLLHCVQVESPSQMMERFRSLFIDGVSYRDAEILKALDEIADSKLADQEFKYVVNRCCHILINRWQMQPQLQAAIPELVALFESRPAGMGIYSPRYRSIRRLRELIKVFTESEQYLTLRRLSQVIQDRTTDGGGELNSNLGMLIRRYPYLYEHCLLSEDSTYEHQQAVRQMQAQAQQQFEVDLSQYVTHQVRQSQYRYQQSGVAVKPLIGQVKNPTLLSDRELFSAINQYTGKVDGSYTYRDLAQSFLTHTTHTPSFRKFKGELYSYLVSSIDPAYGNLQFNNRLYNHLQNILTHNDSQPFNEFLLLRTCSHLLNFLVVDSRQQPQHFVFIDLIANTGINFTIGLLLKIVLICRKVKPYLEKRFSILFNHYEGCGTDAVMWLIQSLENLNVALSIHFGAVDLSYLKQLKQV